MMVETIRPRGAVSSKILTGVMFLKGKYYVVDRCGNKMQVHIEDYWMVKSMEGMKNYGTFN